MGISDDGLLVIR